jgi:2-keto-4-pentenoate hydratase/2-oxohepta-3-ene-1,7-dioic acid hydratase in catechol pathway
MKLLTYERGEVRSWGVLTDEGIRDVPASWPEGPTGVRALLEAGPDAMDELARRMDQPAPTLSPGEVRLRAPIPRPPKVLGLAVNYVAHHRELERPADMPDDPHSHTTPRPFLMPPTVVAGPGDDIPWPRFSREIDYEVELAAIIGRRCKDVDASQAGDCIAGYTIANDISARSVTHARGRTERPKDGFFDWLHGKWADSFCPMGPWLVTSDEMGDPQDLVIQCDVNGRRRQDAHTSLMIFPVVELVAFISRLMTLEPGDVIATGTPAGVGKATGQLLTGGDTITCRIERIGELTNTLSHPPAEFYTPCQPRP